MKMAEKSKKNELSMEKYFNEGLAEDTEPNNPFDVVVEENRNAAKRRKRTLHSRRIIIFVVIVLLLILGILIAVFITHRRNDGARYARKLSESIGMPITAAEKNADLTLSPESSSKTLRQLYASYQAIAESRKSCKIQGVRLPEWAIFCNTEAEELINVTYYNYEVLEKNVFGIERKAYVDPNTVQSGSSWDQVEDQLGLTPFRIQYLQGQTEIREYRYCYADEDSGDIVAYVITAVQDETGKLSISDVRKNYIGSLLASP